MRNIVRLGDNECPQKIVGIEIDCPLVDVKITEGNKTTVKKMRDVTDFFNNSEEIKAMMIKVER